jgi:23S rRNA (cytosine1962-C5)-methyltransferase
MVLTMYSIRASFFLPHNLLMDAFGNAGGVIESGELTIREQSGGRLLSTSLFSRWVSS